MVLAQFFHSEMTQTSCRIRISQLVTSEILESAFKWENKHSDWKQIRKTKM